MKVILAIIILVAIVGVGFYAYTNTSVPQSKVEEVTQETDKMEQNESSRYITYSKANLVSSASSRRVLFFYANWCPTCRPADANFTQNESTIPSDVTLIRVNYNDPDTDQEEKALAQQYGVTYQHTFVQIDQNGEEVNKWNGGQIEELLKNIK